MIEAWRQNKISVISFIEEIGGIRGRLLRLICRAAFGQELFDSGLYPKF